MATAILLARIISIVALSFGIGFFLNKSYYRKEIINMLNNSGMVFIGGLMAIIVGMLILSVHNIWVWDWNVLITIIGWIALIKGVSLLLFPNVMDWFKPLFRAKSINYVMALALLIGLVFGYWGFLA